MAKQMTIRSHATTNRPSVTLSGLLVARTAEPSARTRAGELAVPQYHLSVHQHVLDAERGLMRLLERGAIDDRRRIENGDVCIHARTHEAAIDETDALSGERRHLAHRKLEGHEFFIAHVAAQDAGERTVGAGMCAFPAERAVGRD